MAEIDNLHVWRRKGYVFWALAVCVVKSNLAGHTREKFISCLAFFFSTHEEESYTAQNVLNIIRNTSVLLSRRPVSTISWVCVCILNYSRAWKKALALSHIIIIICTAHILSFLRSRGSVTRTNDSLQVPKHARFFQPFKKKFCKVILRLAGVDTIVEIYMLSNPI